MSESSMTALNEMSREELIKEIDSLRQCLVDADAVTRARFEYYGLCDCIDNCGRPYPSQWSHDLIELARTTHAPCSRLERFAG